MMVLTLKIISAAACYQDGSKPEKVCALFIYINSPCKSLESTVSSFRLVCRTLCSVPRHGS
jgi:hypothetical protein